MQVWSEAQFKLPQEADMVTILLGCNTRRVLRQAERGSWRPLSAVVSKQPGKRAREGTPMAAVSSTWQHLFTVDVAHGADYMPMVRMEVRENVDVWIPTGGQQSNERRRMAKRRGLPRRWLRH